MGNKGSTDSPAVLNPAQQREENVYEDYVTPALSSIARPSLPPLPPAHVGGGEGGGGGGGGGGGTNTPPPLRRSVAEQQRQSPRTHERRSMTVVGRGEQHRKGDAALRRLSTSDAILQPHHTAQDSLTAHIVDSLPLTGEEGVELATSIVVTFDKDVVTINPSKLFEVKCDLDPSDKPAQGRATYDSKAQRAEFTPLHTLHPDALYTVTLAGRAVTTSSSSNVANAEISFKTCSPPPKNIGIKLKGQKTDQVERLQIANYYDLYNSLVVWSTRQWGCSGEHVVRMFVEGEDKGRLQPLKADHDVLRLRDNDIVVIEIKD